MDQSVRNLLNKKMKLGGQELNVSDVLLLAAITVLAVWVRTAVRSFVAQDWTDYWSLWLEELRVGGFKALAGNFYDYAPPVMYLLYLITKGRGIGGGDIKLMAATGLLLGWKNIILAFVLGCILGSVIHIVRMKVAGAQKVLAMGPYLAAGIWIAGLYGQQMINWYLGILIGA